jgi:ubiquinone/menaquinone biosynthesis C-methylase UbiE
MYLPDSSILTNIQVPGHTRFRDILFEKKYITTRSLENRIYTDEELAKLPEIAEDHTHFREWQARARTIRLFLRYLSARKKSLEILEIGCGNGWLSHKLAEIKGSKVVGADINFTELQQAARVFNDDPNLTFVHGDIRTGILDGRQFDIIVFAATIEYFPSLKKILHTTLSFLKPAGEIHVMDSRICRPDEVDEFKRQKLAYYTSMGYPEMADFHYHHSMADLRPFHYDLRYHPHSVKNILQGRKNPYPWVRVKNC